MESASGTSARPVVAVLVLHTDGADPEVAALVASYAPLVSAAGAQLVGTVSETISKDPDAALQKPAGLMIADAFLEATAGDAVVAFTNAGGVRASFEYPMSGDETVDGQVTYAEIYNMSPFSNSVLTMSLTGAQLEAVLEQQFTNAGPNRLQPSSKLRKLSLQHLGLVDRVLRAMPGVVRMEMRGLVVVVVHPNGDPEEPADRGHRVVPRRLMPA